MSDHVRNVGVMGQPADRAAVIDDGTGLYLWEGLRDGLEKHRAEWAFLALFRCEHCGRDVTIVRADRSKIDERSLSRMRACPGGCEAATQWLAPAA